MKLLTNVEMKEIAERLVREFQSYKGWPEDFIRYAVYHTESEIARKLP